MSAADARNRSDTRERCLRAAESLFLEHGYEGASLRLITAKARVNLAAVNYHFGGKEGLFQAMLARRLDPLGEARRALLDQYQREAGDAALDCEAILAALFIPALALARDAKLGGKDFLRLLGRAYVDPSPALRAFLSDRYAPVVARFKDAFGRALPLLSKQELSWRLHFMLGALSYTLSGADTWKLIAALNPLATENDLLLLKRLAPFLIAGLKAPLPDLAAPGLLDAGDAGPLIAASNTAAVRRTPAIPRAA